MTEKRPPTREELQQVLVALGPAIVTHLQAMKGQAVPDAIEMLQSKLRDHIAGLVQSQQLPDVAWPQLDIEHDVQSGRLKVGFKDLDPPQVEESPEETDRRVKGATDQVWNMMADTLRRLDPEKRAPNCTNISMGLAIFAALMACGMDQREALAGAAWKTLTHHDDDGSGKRAGLIH